MEKTMNFPAWHEVSESSQDEMPNTTVIGEVVELINIPYTGTEPEKIVIIKPPLGDYTELPVDV